MSQRDDLVLGQVRWLLNAWMVPKIAWRGDHHTPHIADPGRNHRRVGSWNSLDQVFGLSSRARAVGNPAKLGELSYCMNHPWLTTTDCPVSAFEPKEARNKAVSATSSTVVNSPSTVSFSMTFLMTSCSEMPSVFACSGICLSTSGVRTKPGQISWRALHGQRLPWPQLSPDR